MEESPWVLEPYIRANSSYNEPVDIPATPPNVAPYLAARIPKPWLELILGALSQLRMPPSWIYTTNAQLSQVMLWVDDLIGVIGEAMPFVEAGSVSITILAGNSDASATVTFPIAFDVAPVVVQSSDSEVLIASRSAVTSTGFTATITAATPVLVNTTALYSWIAQEAS